MVKGRENSSTVAHESQVFTELSLAENWGYNRGKQARASEPCPSHCHCEWESL